MAISFLMRASVVFADSVLTDFFGIRQYCRVGPANTEQFRPGTVVCVISNLASMFHSGIRRLRRRLIDPRVLSTNVGCKLLGELPLEIPRYFIQ